MEKGDLREFSSLYLLFPACSPVEGSEELSLAMSELSSVSAGEGRSFAMQAIYQLLSLGITLVVAIGFGALTGN